MDDRKHRTIPTESLAPAANVTAARYEAKVGHKRASREDVKAQLDSKSADISARLAHIQDNVVGSSERAKQIVESPLLPVAGSLLAGIALGFLFGGSSKSPNARSVLSPDVSELLVRKVNEANAAGGDAVEAVQNTISKFATSKPQQSNGIVTALGGLLVNLAVKQAVSYFESRSANGDASEDAGLDDTVTRGTVSGSTVSGSTVSGSTVSGSTVSE